MSNDLNQCNFIGRLGKDPEVKYTGSGEPVTSFSIAVGSKFGDKEQTEWVNVTTFKKLAEICGEYLKKGSQVFITGRLQTDSWEKEGVKQYRTKVIADRMQMLGAKEGSQQKPVKQPQSNDNDPIPF
jgi:single-strand DNA-binding protein